MRQAFAIPIVEEISNTSSENETENDNNNSRENNCGEEIIEDNTDIKAIGAEDLDSLFAI